MTHVEDRLDATFAVLADPTRRAQFRPCHLERESLDAAAVSFPEDQKTVSA